jgi:hypothetical protein
MLRTEAGRAWGVLVVNIFGVEGGEEREKRERSGSIWSGLSDESRYRRERRANEKK